MTTSILKHQQTQITAIRQLIEQTRSRETELLEEISTRHNDAIVKKEKATNSYIELAASKRLTTERIFEKDSAAVEKRRELEPEILKERHDRRLSEIEEEAEDLIETTEAKSNEAQWLSESV